MLQHLILTGTFPGDMIDSFASGFPVLDTETRSLEMESSDLFRFSHSYSLSRGWVEDPFGDNITGEDVAHHEAIALSEKKVIFLFGLKLFIKVRIHFLLI